jgi:hypothetical protein
MKVVKGTILLNGHFQDFRITISAKDKNTEEEIGAVLQRKLQQKGWTRNV